MENKEKTNDVVRRAVAADAPFILKLLRENSVQNLKKEELKDGFVIYNPTLDELLKVIADTGVFVCFEKQVLKGYFMSMSRELAETIPFENELLQNSADLKYDNKQIKNYKHAIYAQICIAKEYRGGQIFKKLHVAAEQSLVVQGYELGIAEIAEENIKSKSVHGFMPEIGTYESKSGIHWHIHVRDLRK